jgi:hypothetical protein
MKGVRATAAVFLTGLLAVGTVALAGPASAHVTTPTLVGIRAAHHPTYDRIVFDFQGGLPARVRVEYVPELIADGSGLPVPLAGQAILQVSMSPAQAHDDAGQVTAPGRVSFPLPNIITAVRSGDFEAVTTYGIGLTQKEGFHTFALTSPDRVVIDIGAAFPTVQRQVYFFDAAAFASGAEPFYVPVLRPVLPKTPATGAMDRLFAGPTAAEQSRGLQFLSSGATGFRNLSISQGVARVQLTGGCNSGGSTATIAGEIFPTLRQFSTVDFVKIFDPAGKTETQGGSSDSIPFCLEP